MNISCDEKSVKVYFFFCINGITFSDQFNVRLLKLRTEKKILISLRYVYVYIKVKHEKNWWFEFEKGANFPYSEYLMEKPKPSFIF